MKNKMTVAVCIIGMWFFCINFSSHQAGETYKLGLSLAITGPTSDAGNPYAKGVEDYFNYVNDMKLLGDDKIDCTIRDDQYKTDVTKRNFEDFLDMGIVFYLNYSTGSTMALKKDFDEEDAYHPGLLPCRQPGGVQLHLPAHCLLFGPGHRAG
jgi:branched-chain amino acid transport system substrate-binding protein